MFYSMHIVQLEDTLSGVLENALARLDLYFCSYVNYCESMLFLQVHIPV